MIVWEALDALSHQLELCRIDASRRVVLLFDDQIGPDRSTLIRAALSRTGAQALDVRPVRAEDALDNDLVHAVIGACNVVITTDPAAAHALVDHDVDTLLLHRHGDPEHFPPHANLRRRVHAAANQLTREVALHLSDRHGTSLTFELAANETRFDHGLLDDTNTDAAFPAGWAATDPSPGTVDGDLIIMPGDANVTAARLISSPVRCEIVDNYITSIHGESPDADIIRAYLEYANDDDAYVLASCAIGLNPGTHIVGAFDDQLLQPHLAQLAAGVVTLSFGSQRILHLALPNRSVTVGGLPLIVEGTLQGDIAPDVYES